MKLKSAFAILCLILLVVVANRLDLFSSFDEPDIAQLSDAIVRQYDGFAKVETISCESGEPFGSYEDKYHTIPYTARIAFTENVVARKDLMSLIRLTDFFDRHYRQCRYWVTANSPPEKVDPITQDLSVDLFEQCSQCLGIFDYYKNPFFSDSVYAIKGVATFEKYFGGDWELFRFTIQDPKCLEQAPPPDWLSATNYPPL